MYKITSTEERNEKATDFETKSMLYMMNYYSNADKVEWFVIDFFNDVTGVDSLCSECFDIQSKGVKDISPMQLGEITRLGDFYQDNGWVFTQVDGKRCNPSYFTHEMSRLCAFE